MLGYSVYSEAGGVAKTTTAANCAVAHARHGFDILAIDLDPQNASLTYLFGVDDGRDDGRPIDLERFSLIVVDEATQASIPATAVPLKFGSKLVLAGDHKQLPRYHSGENASDEAFHPSLFEYLLDRFGGDAKTTLRR